MKKLALALTLATLASTSVAHAQGEPLLLGGAVSGGAIAGGVLGLVILTVVVTDSAASSSSTD